MTVRQLNGSSDDLITAVGTLGSGTSGTFAAIVKRAATGTWHTILATHNSSGDPVNQFAFNGGTDQLHIWQSTGPDSDSAITWANTADWALVVVRKPAGSSVARFSLYDFTAETWTHTAGTVSIADWPTAAGGGIRFRWQSFDHYDGLVAIRAGWNSIPWSTDATGDAALEAAGLEVSAANWLAESPDMLQLFNQAAVTDLVEDETGGGADEVSRSGTAVVTDDDPPGFSFAAAGGDPVAIDDTPTGLRMAGVSNVEIIIETDIDDKAVGLRLGGPTETVTTDAAPATVINDTPTGLRLSGVTALDVVVSFTLEDFPTGVRLGGPAGTTAIDVVLTDTPTGVRLNGPTETVTTALPGDMTLNDNPSGVRLSGPSQALTIGTVRFDIPTGVRLSGPSEIVTTEAFPATLVTDTPNGIRLSGPAGVVTLDAVHLDRPSGLRLSAPDENVTTASPITEAAIITGVDITGIAAKAQPVVNGLAVSRDIFGPRGHRIVIGPGRVTIDVQDVGSAGSTIVVTGAGSKDTPEATGVGVRRVMTGPRYRRLVTGPKVGPE